MMLGATPPVGTSLPAIVHDANAYPMRAVNKPEKAREELNALERALANIKPLQSQQKSTNDRLVTMISVVSGILGIITAVAMLSEKRGKK